MARKSRPDKGRKSADRRRLLLNAAAAEFANRGYDATTMRDIAAKTKILAGSIYYYFKSKEELFCAVHEEAVRRIRENALHAIDADADPWTRLEQASRGYLESMLGDELYARVIVTEFPRRRASAMRRRLVEHRDTFEEIFRDIVRDLPLRRGIDRRFWRLALMGMLAWTFTWYRPGGHSPSAIAGEMINLLRNKTDT